MKAATTTTDYVYDRAGHMIAEANDATGAMIREYIWMDDTPVAMVDYSGGSPVVYDIHTDHLGRPQKLTDQSGGLQWDGVFDPFGNPYSINGSLTMLLGFPGQYWDSETQLAQNWHRDYDPSIGRYVESDPIGLWGGVNTYGYVRSNPLSHVDLTGLFSYEAWTEAEELAAGEEVAGLGPEDPFADIGAAVTLGVGFSIAASLPGNTPGGGGGGGSGGNKSGCNCPPCNPPVGTIGYRTDVVPPSSPHYPFAGSHTHLYQMNQNRQTCKCYWNKLDVIDGTTPPAGAVPMP